MLSNGLLFLTTLLLDMYPSIDGKLFTTKEQRDAHNASLPTHDDEYIRYVPFSATRDLNESIRNGAA